MNSSENDIRTLPYRPSFMDEPIPAALFISSYTNNHGLYIEIWDTEECEPFTDMTVNVDGSEKLAPYQAAVKYYSENDGIERFIVDTGLGTPTGQTIQSGLVSVPVYQFSREKLLEYSLNGVSGYEEVQGKANRLITETLSRAWTL